MIFINQTLPKGLDLSCLFWLMLASVAFIIIPLARQNDTYLFPVTISVLFEVKQKGL